MAAMQMQEDTRLVAIHKLAAVRRFAHADAEPCQVLQGLFVGAAHGWCSTKQGLCLLLHSTLLLRTQYW